MDAAHYTPSTMPATLAPTATGDRSEIGEGGWHDDENPALTRARDTYYPGWWTYAAALGRGDAAPVYRVVCRSDDERRLAEAVKPRFVDAIFVSVP
jgi:hypothetical protein